VELYSSYVIVATLSGVRSFSPSVDFEFTIMSKRKLVPTALHSELTEYSSLIRALRTNNALDVTSHIAKPLAGSSLQPRDTEEDLNSDDDDDDDSEGGGEDLEVDAGRSEDNDAFSETPLNIPESASQSREISPTSGRSSPLDSPQSLGRKRKWKRKSLSPSEPRRRDAWTRWPLLADDVHIPEWSLEDELGLLAANALKNQNRPPLPPSHAETPALRSDASEDPDSDDADGDPSTYLPHLLNASSNYLSTILALLVAHTPNRPHSQQNRIEPIGWRAVLDMLSSCDDPRVANQKCVLLYVLFTSGVRNNRVCRIIKNVKIRMEALYGPSECETSGEILGSFIGVCCCARSDRAHAVAHRMQSSISAKARLKSKMSRPVENLFMLVSPSDPVDTAQGHPGTP
jgi:hypothetical protein